MADNLNHADVDRSRPVAVIGAGVMGRGIAQVAAVAGFATRLVDVRVTQLDAAITAVETDLRRAVERGRLSADEAPEARARLTTTTRVALAAQDAGLVIEAVVERVDVKRQVLAEAEAVAATDAVLATNTSALSVTEIVSALDTPERGVGMHFFNPVPRMRLCEIVVPLQASTATITTAESMAHAMGKQTVQVKDLPGFATSRLNALLGNEAMRMLEDGVASAEDIDTAARLGLNHPMGPLEMVDLVGLDTRLDILEYLEGALGERFRPSRLQRQLVAAGRLGRKTGHGIYRYDADGGRIDEPADVGD